MHSCKGFGSIDKMIKTIILFKLITARMNHLSAKESTKSTIFLHTLIGLVFFIRKWCKSGGHFRKKLCSPRQQVLDSHLVSISGTKYHRRVPQVRQRKGIWVWSEKVAALGFLPCQEKRGLIRPVRVGLFLSGPLYRGLETRRLVNCPSHHFLLISWLQVRNIHR